LFGGGPANIVVKARHMTRLLALVGLVVADACAAPHVDSPRVSDVPFIHGPAVNWTNDPSTGYHVELTIALQRNLIAADKLAFVVKVGADEVDRYPITKGEIGTT